MQFWFLEAETWSDAVICGCEQFNVVEVDNGDNFSHLERFYQEKIYIILYNVLPMFAIDELYKVFVVNAVTIKYYSYRAFLNGFDLSGLLLG